MLNEKTHYRWRAINISKNGHTARDLWFSLAQKKEVLTDCYQACVLIGANDVANRSPIDLFEEYYRQIVEALQIHGLKVVYCGQIPVFWPDGHPFFPSDLCELQKLYNERIERVVSQSPIGQLVRLPDLCKDCFTDPVHFNEKGNRLVAECFAQKIISY
jgi:lysophospholipase L1-like esterase